MIGRILLTGGSGRLGTELRKLIECDAPSHRKLDVTKKIFWPRDYALIIHCVGFTSVARAETEKTKCFNTNVIGTYNMALHFTGIPFVHISTEYVYNPVNFYSRTKVMSEKMLRNPSLCIRTLFKPRPYPFNRAWTDQYTRGDYVDVIAPMIVGEILRWDKKCSRTVDVGTGRKSIYELAKQSRPRVKKAKLAETKLPVILPMDYI